MQKGHRIACRERGGKRLPAHAGTQAEDQARTGLGIHNVPDLGLAAIPLVGGGISIVGMHLYRQRAGRVNPFDQQREARLSPNSREGLSGQWAVCDYAHAVVPHRQFP